ncbi:hypothetical protein EG329_014237 [Mollisiaceae sp. DMI_Dod_QoI]|nr:hypothetical protein EG329_014237 [Helotiales sp. DMI_Dod_QoI]
MESWSNGRERLFEQLTKVCDQIGNKLQAELDENFVRISQEELRSLREKSTAIDVLHKRYKGLSYELEACRAAATRVDGLEQENKRLAAELQRQLQPEQRTLATPRARLVPKDDSHGAPAPSDPSSSVTRIDYDETKPVALEKYQSQVLKYNNLHDRYNDMREARQKLEDLLRVEKEKNREWNAFKEEQDKSNAKRNEKIKRLEAEVRRLRTQVQGETRGLDARTPADHDVASSRLGLTKHSLYENGEEDILRSCPIKNPAAHVALLEDTRISDETFEVGNVFTVKDTPESVDLLTHLSDVDQAEGTQHVALETHHTSSTEGDINPYSPKKTTDQKIPVLLPQRSPSPDTPVVISSRSVKKRKNRHESTGATSFNKVKFEIIGSSPIGLARLTYLNVNESLDLDDIGEKVNTPRKQRYFQQELSRQPSQGLLHPSQRENRADQSPNPDQGCSNFSYHNMTSNNTPIRPTDSVLQPRSTNRPMLPQNSEGRPQKKRRIASDKDVGTLMEDGELATNLRLDPCSNGRLIDLLSKPSPTRQALVPTRLHTTNQQATRSYRSIAISGLGREVTTATHQGLPNDGTRTPRITGESTPKVPTRDATDVDGLPATSSRPTSKGSVASYFESSRPSSRETSRTSVEPQRHVSRSLKKDFLEPEVNDAMRRSAELDVQKSNPLRSSLEPKSTLLPPPRRDLHEVFTSKPQPLRVEELVSDRNSKQDMATASKSRRRPKTNTTLVDCEIDPDQGPLRARPLEKLRLQDFKVNLNYNQGYEYAYRDVVRGDARHALEGCTKPECCGHKFRVLAELNTVESPTASQEERDDELLRNHMGDNAHKLRSMSKHQRHELLMQAKTRDIANQHGRHRHAYTRAASPPGFWRPDFPTTQEEMADREKAKEREREMIIERYEAAMRPGGKYMFRDE